MQRCLARQNLLTFSDWCIIRTQLSRAIFWNSRFYMVALYIKVGSVTKTGKTGFSFKNTFTDFSS